MARKRKTVNERMTELIDSGEPFMLPNGSIVRWEDEPDMK